MAVARQNEVQQGLGRIEKELDALRKNRLTAVPLSEYKTATAGMLPIILTIIAVVGGSYYLLSERFGDVNNRFDDVNKRIDDTNDLIRMVNSDLKEDIKNLEKNLKEDIEDINEKLDRLLLQ